MRGKGRGERRDKAGEGETLTVMGHGLSLTPGENAVSVDGLECMVR